MTKPQEKKVLKSTDDIVAKIQEFLKKDLFKILSNQNKGELTEKAKVDILNSINENLLKILGDVEFENFCNYLNKRNITLMIHDKNYILNIGFYNGLIFINFKDIFKDYFLYKYNKESCNGK